MNQTSTKKQESTSKFKQGNWPMILALIGLVAAMFVIKVVFGMFF